MFRTTIASAFALCASLGAQQVVASYDFENQDLTATTSAKATASDLSISNSYMFGGPGGGGATWLCLTRDWNNVGGSITFTVTPVAGQTIDFTRLCWTAVTNNTAWSDSVASIEVLVDGVLVDTVDPVTHNTKHSIDLAAVEALHRRMTPVSFELRATGNPNGATAYEIDGIHVEASACVENLTASNRIVWLPISGISNYWTALDGAGLTEFVDGTAELTAAIVNRGDADLRMSVRVTLTGRVDADEPPPPGSPKTNSLVTGSGVDTGLWRYYTGLTGTLTGRDKLEGFAADLDRRGEALQIGVGANLKELAFGLSSWFNVNITSQASSCPLSSFHNGDFNLNLGDSCVCIGGQEATWENYGQGSPACNGGPSLTLASDPITNKAIEFQIGNDGTSSVPCALLLSMNPAVIDVPFLGGTILVELPLLVQTALTVPPGGGIVNCFVREDPCGIGACVYLQAICLEPCGSADLSFSRGLEVCVGDL